MIDTNFSNFSLIIPAYDEEENIALLFKEIKKTFDQHGLIGEIILVDDGSKDQTYNRAVQAKSVFEDLKIIRHRKNLGKTEAIVSGAKISSKSIIIVFDADLQYSPEDIPRFLNKINEGYDIVTGKKIGDYQKPTVSFVYNKLCQLLFGIPVSDMNSMKAFKKEIFKSFYLRHDWHRFLVALSHTYGYSMTEIDVQISPRKYGVPKYGGYGRILIGLMDLLSVKFKVTFARKPLLFFGSVGIGLILLGILIGLFAIYLRVFMQAGFRPLLYLVMLLIIIGCISLIGGFLGEIVSDLSDRIEMSFNKEKDSNK